ncbi:TadE/TadG family type IV pilus assembly protein [Jannaschia sp. 2305UL9-9]|uniref:TadE/TadG family type IV pilus assembly protein n=1 Tax=Jannaschia sp. 2305UL9-9 TaxID=3121638 RepID=UPI0035299022
MAPILRSLATRCATALTTLDQVFSRGPDNREDGAATVEFVILLPVFLAVFLSSFEASLLLSRQVMLERGVDVAVRQVRLDSRSTVSQNALRNEVCAIAKILPDCETNLLVELQEIDTVTYDLPSTAQPCVNRETSVTPAAEFEADRASKLILMRACFAVDPFMPGAGLGTQLVTDVDGSSMRIVAATAFVVEPV